MLIAHLNLLAAVVGAVAEPAAGEACADAIHIEANAKDSRQLRGLLQESSLSSLRTESCHGYSAKLTRTDSGGWTVEMTSESSSRKLERQVTTLQHAATWIESWTQSGFASMPEDPDQRPAATPAPIAPVPAPAAPAVAVTAPLHVFLGVGPMAAVTSNGYGFVGGTLHAGYPARRVPWFGAELGAASQIDPGSGSARSVYWAGPMVGGSFPIASHVRLRPAFSFGVLGTTAHNTVAKGHTAALYAGLGSDVEIDVTRNLALFFGFDGRLLFGTLAGSPTTTPPAPVCTDDDCEDLIPPAATVSTGLGPFWGALRLGVVWNFGGAA